MAEPGQLPMRGIRHRGNLYLRVEDVALYIESLEGCVSDGDDATAANNVAAIREAARCVRAMGAR